MSTETFLIASEAEPTQPRRNALHRLLRDPQAVITASFLIVVFVAGVLAPLITQHGPNDSSLEAVNAPAGTPGYPLGGDQSGRDIFSRLLYSINTAAISGLIGTGIAIVIGLSAGLIGGYFGGRLRSGVEWVFSLIMAFPGLLILIVLMPLTGGDYRATMFIFGILLSPGVYRIVRNVTVGVKGELYVDAARVSGVSTIRILVRHVMRVVRGPVIIAAAFLIGTSIGVQSGLAFLGLGSTEEPSFGAMLSSGFQNMYVYPLQFMWPAILWGLMSASLVLLGNSLRDALEGERPKAAKLGGRARSASAAAAGGASVGADGPDAPPVLSIDDLRLGYPRPDGTVREILKGVSLELRSGETLGLVGESGSGKTQTAFAALGVLPPQARVTGGSIKLEGREILGLGEKELRGLRGQTIAYVPQEPMSSLDPSFTVGSQLVEGIRAATAMSRSQAHKYALQLLGRVGIADPKTTFGSYPHQISGGMAQRVLIAAAVAAKPKVLIADEPTTALDVTIQAEILDLLRDLQEEMGMAILLVTHNFGVVADMCDRIAVMRHGEIVETGDVFTVFRAPSHPYTQKLLDAILDDDFVELDVEDLAATTNGVRA
ncbi:peptide/nickel transport system permease protein [Microbacterium trichothecenolyticum]|uniref:dipeptide/oligopeptide/nickel ABC transporter permease/ATP-binding protein n=1 Tax=Microbacterium trichothecenolyticum TaxID=69370 RepID=UPI0028588B98|nr:dipeptide/oligopeptide/nickel ABC transporter permease/ATP-binding protein [Microbacterium trichothecenolyticum]MDR7113702.1 peptide/nickel transport system permease protein [Microbacterium trichothecenolyticum]